MKRTLLSLSLLVALPVCAFDYCQVPGRPPVAERSFRSAAVDAKVEEVAAKIKDPELRKMFVACFPCTLDTTVRGDGFVITGDIDAMWLRDSAAERVLQYAREGERVEERSDGYEAGPARAQV